MLKKIIVFDVDGVITDSASKKYEAFFAVMQKYKLENHPEIAELLSLRVNRGVLSHAVAHISNIPQYQILRDIEIHLKEYESEGKTYPMVSQVKDFIEKNYSNYTFFTNTAMYKETVEKIFHILGIEHFFKEIFAYDTGTKLENIEKIISHYNISPKDILFIDDMPHNIDTVTSSGVHTLLFEKENTDLQMEVDKIFHTN